MVLKQNGLEKKKLNVVIEKTWDIVTWFWFFWVRTIFEIIDWGQKANSGQTKRINP